MSQGRLEALLNFQQMVMDLTGMELANASLLDEATAAAEAMAMARRVSKSRSARFFVDADCHPQTIAVVRTRAERLGIDVVTGDPYRALDGDPHDDPHGDVRGDVLGDVFGVLVQYPGSSGALRDPTPVVERVHAGKGLAVFATDLLAACLVEPPGAFGADIVVGSAQRFGVPMGFGGPHAAFFATRDAYKRQTPGTDHRRLRETRGAGLPFAWRCRPASSTSRREKATSNICTAQVLLAVMAGMYAVYHGPERLRAIAERVHRLTRVLATGLAAAGREVVTRRYFDTITVRVPGEADALVARARDAGFNVRRVDGDHVGLALDETTRREDVQGVLAALGRGAGADGVDIEALDAAAPDVLGALARRSGYLAHPVFHIHHSETQMLRYLRRLTAKDVALDRSMIPLGSCTMKLNATSEMIPVTFPGFGALHPFVPADQATGYRALCTGLERMLCAITGFDAVSLQPNAGSQGEYAGLLCIRRYHESRGEGDRDVCLIPASAHGTNPASAIMAGMRVVVVACDDSGNVDLADLARKAREHGTRLGALMSTIRRPTGCRGGHRRHLQSRPRARGAGVHGRCEPERVGGPRPARAHRGRRVAHQPAQDVLHPARRWRPGMGPIGVRAHLAPYLPDHPVVTGVNPAADPSGTVGTVSAAPWGSAGILPISWAYIAMMGARRPAARDRDRDLGANYIAATSRWCVPGALHGRGRPRRHECIIDLRPVKASCGVTVEDVAKRLVDYGFHAPTMSFPVADTLMIEPTESESEGRARSLLRCDAGDTRGDRGDRGRGRGPGGQRPGPCAPHRGPPRRGALGPPYSKAQAFFPLSGAREDKYWPPVGRVDNVYGDRNLACACPPPEAYDEAAD